MKKLITCLAFALVACADDSTSLQLSSTQVELDVFSGRPNPSWVLTATEADGLESRLAQLPRSSAPVPAGRLGYRGFIVHDGDARIAIGGGLIVVSRGEAREVYEDRHDAEDYLFKQAVQRGYGGLIATDS